MVPAIASSSALMASVISRSFLPIARLNRACFARDFSKKILAVSVMG
jgi:hypothetical protein